MPHPIQIETGIKIGATAPKETVFAERHQQPIKWKDEIEVFESKENQTWQEWGSAKLEPNGYDIWSLTNDHAKLISMFSH